MKSKKTTEKAYAKINLFLNVTGLRHDGYHILSTLMQTVSLYDTVRVKKSRELTCKCPGVISEKNIAYKAVRALENKVGKELPVEIKIKKRIPSKAGLGGGSADAAAAVRAVVKLYDVEISEEDLISVCEEAGADVPFLLFGKTAICEGIGEVMQYQPSFPKCFIALAKPEEGNSTPQMFKAFDEKGVFSPSLKEKFSSALKKGNLKELCALISNDLTPFDLSGKVKQIKEKFLECGALASEMSGSGTAVFAVFEDKKKAKKALRALKKSGLKTFLTVPN